MNLRELALCLVVHEFLKLRNLLCVEGKTHAYLGTFVSMKTGKSEPDITTMFRNAETGKESILVIHAHHFHYV